MHCGRFLREIPHTALRGELLAHELMQLFLYPHGARKSRREKRANPCQNSETPQNRTRNFRKLPVLIQTVHDYLRARLLNQAGVFEPAEPAPSLGEIARVQSCPSFEEYRRNRLIMGYFRYGSLQSQIGRAKYDNVSSI